MMKKSNKNYTNLLKLDGIRIRYPHPLSGIRYPRFLPCQMIPQLGLVVQAGYLGTV